MPIYNFLESEIYAAYGMRLTVFGFCDILCTMTKQKREKVKKPNIWQYLGRYKLWIFLYFFVYIVASVGDVFFTILLAKSVELITLAKYKRAIINVAIVIGINVVQRCCWYTCHQIYNRKANKVMSELNLDLAKQAFKLDSKTFNDHDTGTFVQRIVDDPMKIVDGLATFVDVFMNLATVAVIFIYIATLNIYVSLAIVGIVLIAFVIEYNKVKARRKNRSFVRKVTDNVNSLTTEIVRSEKDIKSLGLERKLSEVSKLRYEECRRARFKLDMTDSNFETARNAVIGLGTLLTLILGIYFMDLGILTLATYMILYSNRGSVWDLVWNIGQLTNLAVDIRVSHDRMFSLYDEHEFVTEKFGERSLDNVTGEIEFKDVSYTFREFEFERKRKPAKAGKQGKVDYSVPPEKKLVSENQIFKNLSFKITPNTTVAFVGKSGSGKSTILNLMSKMYTVDSGEVLIDNVNINELNKESLRKTISLVNQFPYIFDMTIKDNLLLAKGDATDEEITDAISKASLDEFVASLPKGVDTKVGESGIKLSGGQKQRLAIARALLRNSPIIIFDESTSSLDNFAQEEVKKSIDGLKGKSTIVIVAHRLSTIKNVDHIFFLENGEIVDEGTFEQLFKKNKNFKAMFLAENI